MSHRTPRRIRGKIEAGHRAYGVAVQMPSPETVEIIGLAGYDYAWLDAEHGPFDLSEVKHLIRAADAVGIDAIVRVPDHSPTFIQGVLDSGATGIMVPHVRTVADARRVSAAARYSPVGVRGACPTVRSTDHYTKDWTADHTRADADVFVFGLIEDVEGVEHVEAIAADGGLDGLLFGPFDLSMALGLDGDVFHPQVRQLHARVVRATQDAGIDYVTATVAWEPGGLDATGTRIVTVLGDRSLIYETCVNALGAQTGDREPVRALS